MSRKDMPALKVKKKPVIKCSECGMCKNVCPVYKVCLNEFKSPRAKAILRKNKIADTVEYDCTLCLACETACPLNIEFDHIDVRKKLIEMGNSPEANKEMLKNIKEFGNPFGKIEKGNKLDKLYCC